MMILQVLDGKCLYTPSGAAAEYANVGCNFYRGCPYQCKYCYNRKGWTAKVMGVDHAVLENVFTNMKYRPKKYKSLTDDEYALTVFRHEVDKDLEYLQQTGIFFSFSTDPMCDDCVKSDIAGHRLCPFKKRPCEDSHQKRFLDRGYFEFLLYPPPRKEGFIGSGFTLTGCDDWEPNASPNAERVSMMKNLHEKGFKTFASIEPIIDWNKSYQMIVDTVGYCDLYLIGCMSHYKDFYQSGSGTFFLAGMITRRIYNLQQLFDLKIYFKESFRKYQDGMMCYLYDHPGDDVVLPVSADYDIFHEAEKSVLDMLIHSFSFQNRHNGYLLGYEYKTEGQEHNDIFLLGKMFMVYVSTDILQREITTLYHGQPDIVYGKVKNLQTEIKTFTDFLKMFGNDRKIMFNTGDKEQNIWPWLIIFSEQVEDICTDIINDYENNKR